MAPIAAWPGGDGSLLGLAETAPAHDYFGQILDSDGTVLLCLHEGAPTGIPR
jgi:hypothetical protein